MIEVKMSSITPGTIFYPEPNNINDVYFSIEPGGSGLNACPECGTLSDSLLVCVDRAGVAWHICPDDTVYLSECRQEAFESGRDVGEQRYIVCHQDTTGTVDKGKVLYLREKAEQVVEAFNEVCNETGKFYWYEPAKEQPQ